MEKLKVELPKHGPCEILGSSFQTPEASVSNNDMASDNPQQNEALSSKCIASTGDAFRGPVERYLSPAELSVDRREGYQRSNLFRAAKFSPDGSTIITHNEDQCLRSFIVPEGETEQPHDLKPQSKFASPSNIQAFDIYPGFDIEDADSTLVLCGSADTPITLRNILTFDEPEASYLFENPTTEEHRSPRSLAFSLDGKYFIVGSYNHIAVFDTAQKIRQPISSLNLRPRKGTLQLDSWSFTRKSIVSALSISTDGLLAAGTLEREVGLYERQGQGSCNLTFGIYDGAGTGITGLKWTPCGRYLVVAERQSDEMQVYDIRQTQQKVSTLVGRKAMTSQKLGVDVIHTPTGYEVWAGGTDGCVRMWSNPGSQEGLQIPAEEVGTHQGESLKLDRRAILTVLAPVSGVSWDPTGSILATCSGEMYRTHDYDEEVEASEDSDEGSEGKDSDQPFVPDNSLKIWSIL